ncbi:MAG: hypothetical protein A07HB70_00746 [uncultured archaeon A07HB70]|nr:MAG: hypothetical protein A07HB70_00746 [uncultured archaeon A07HB70]
MTLYAVDDVVDAVAATRAFLLPFDRSRWLRLALVVFFVGGGAGLQLSSGAPDAGASVGGSSTLPSLGGAELALVGAAAVVVVGLVLAFLFVSSTMEFVFVASLRRESVALRRDWRANWWRGARLLGFRLALGTVALAAAAVFVGLAVAPALAGVPVGSAVVLLVAVPALVVLAVGAGLAGGFTTAFVVPVMIVDDCGPLAAWRRFWPTLTAGWRQYAAYAVGAFVLRFAAGLLATAATTLAAVGLAVPFGLVALAGVALLGVAEALGWVVVGTAVVLFVLSLVVVSLLVAVPVQTFRRYYDLLVLGDTDQSLDVMVARRRALREA